jgi:hypothetical protein
MTRLPPTRTTRASAGSSRGYGLARADRLRGGVAAPGAVA